MGLGFWAPHADFQHANVDGTRNLLAAAQAEGVVADFKAGRFLWPAGGKQVMSTSHMDNVCRCAILAAEGTPGGRAYFVTDGGPYAEIIGHLVATQGVEPKAHDIMVGLASFLATIVEGVRRTLKLRGAPALTRQQVRMVGFPFTLSDQRARTELGCAPVVSWQEGGEAMNVSMRNGMARLSPQKVTLLFGA